MEFQFKHYRRAFSSSTDILIGKHIIDATDVGNAIIAGWHLSHQLRPFTDHTILKDDRGAFICGWGVAMEPAPIPVA